MLSIILSRQIPFLSYFHSFLLSISSPSFSGLLPRRGALLTRHGVVVDGILGPDQGRFHVRGLVGFLPLQPFELLHAKGAFDLVVDGLAHVQGVARAARRVHRDFTLFVLHVRKRVVVQEAVQRLGVIVLARVMTRRVA